MATIELRTASQQAATTWPTVAGNVIDPYGVTFQVDLAAALAAKGSALAASDVINIATVPAGTALLGGTSQVTLVSDATTITYNIGLAGGSSIASGQDGKTLGYTGAAMTTANIASSASVLTVTLATLTGTATVGKINVNALFLDVAQRNDKPGLAQLKS